ncbi:MAG: ACT domain-containing protein [Candidatus Micrarchaeota archaeon]|nr:ACT domain-containing protein [Candidatus Micrarchaeota archaeon]
MKQITIVADDKVGLLADISYILGKARVNIDAISVEVHGGKAIISLTFKDDKKAISLLANINVESLYLLSRHGGFSLDAVTVSNPKKAAKVLADYLVKGE